MAAGHLAKALKSKPSPIYSKRLASRIETGNFDDDLSAHFRMRRGSPKRHGRARLDIKQQLFERLEQHRTPGTVHHVEHERHPHWHARRRAQRRFPQALLPGGTHFFNPPRYLQLLEHRAFLGQTPCPKCWTSSPPTARESSGKQSVLCKDTPAFIANRVGVFAIQALFHTVEDMGLSVEAVDKFTGPAMGRPKSATFRTCDVVGLDTLVHVAKGAADNCALIDERAEVFAIPSYVKHLVDQGWLGSKSGQGFYKKVVTDGKKEIHALDPATLTEYKLQTKGPVRHPRRRQKRRRPARAHRSFCSTAKTKPVNSTAAFSRTSLRTSATAFLKSATNPTASTTRCAPDLGGSSVPLKAGTPLVCRPGSTPAPHVGLDVAQWVHDLVASGATSFYGVADGKRTCWDVPTKSHTVIPGQDGRIALSLLGEDKTVWANSGTTIQDLGDGILNIAFHTKMNTIGAEVIEGLEHRSLTSPKATPYNGVAWSSATRAATSPRAPTWA